MMQVGGLGHTAVCVTPHSLKPSAAANGNGPNGTKGPSEVKDSPSHAQQLKSSICLGLALKDCKLLSSGLQGCRGFVACLSASQSNWIPQQLCCAA
jgi:hypothetical protein